MLGRRYIHHGLPLRQRGDTIVEVLIAMMVISLVLGGAYVTTNRSLIETRAAQERGNALKLAESQVEQLKSLASSDPTALFGGSTTSPFCIKNNITIAPSTDAACTVDTSGAPTTNEPKFKLTVTRSGNDFTVLNTWTDPSGKNADQLQLVYRVYQ